MIDPDDKQLIAKARKGDARAFEDLVNKYYAVMFKMAFKWCGNQSDAQDITQDACVKLARGLDSFKGNAAFTSWLYRLVINAGKDWYKKHNRHPSNADELENVTTKSTSVEQLYAKQVLGAVQQLPDGEREALILVMSDGLSHKEAAKILDIKESTVSWRIHEARKKLNAQFEKEQSYG
ncbi:MAG: RNA polymerase sigma factor [Alphaproteobacteria bacterium]|nr:RNA polymerase sigma factor [Alphaproteobacteria bacterium]